MKRSEYRTVGEELDFINEVLTEEEACEQYSADSKREVRQFVFDWWEMRTPDNR
jgi:hypothetical protein